MFKNFKENYDLSEAKENIDFFFKLSFKISDIY